MEYVRLYCDCGRCHWIRSGRCTRFIGVAFISIGKWLRIAFHFVSLSFLKTWLSCIFLFCVFLYNILVILLSMPISFHFTVTVVVCHWMAHVEIYRIQRTNTAKQLFGRLLPTKEKTLFFRCLLWKIQIYTMDSAFLSLFLWCDFFISFLSYCVMWT